jgi:hypothetical protein
VVCRLNEEKVFPSPEVSEVLEEHFVEVRLHFDGKKNLDRIQELQESLAESFATPVYVVVDPRTERRVGGRLAGETTRKGFRKYLLDALQAAERVAARD